MSNLAHRQSKIQEKRKKTPRRQFVMEICSWMPLNFYKNNGFMSRFPVSNRTGIIVDYKTFENYGGDFMSYGITYQGNMIEDFGKLYRSMPFTPMFTYGGNENSTFTDWTLGAKNSYLSSTLINTVENALYSFCIKENCINIMNSGIVRKNCNTICNSRLIISSFNVFFSQHIVDSSNIWYSSHLTGCHHCINCTGLLNKSYCIENKQYTQEEFELNKVTYIKKLQIGYERGCDIETNIECHNSENALFGYQLHNTRNTILVGGKHLNSNIYDSANAGGSSFGENHDYYGVLGGGNGSSDIYCCMSFLNSNSLFYSSNLESCSFCLGCIGLKNKSYCILNKQYTKEEWYEKVDEIFAQMDADGSLGEFFPASMNPFYFNDTAAYLIDPSFTKEEVTAKGYLRRDEPIKVDIPAGVQTVKTSELGQYEGRMIDGKLVNYDVIATQSETKGKQSHNGLPQSQSSFAMTGTRYIDPEIMKKVIIDEEGNAYRIIPMEYEFLMKYGLPLPRKHRLDRMKENFRIS